MYLEIKTGLNKQPNIIGKKYPKKIEIRNNVRISSFKKILIFLKIKKKRLKRNNTPIILEPKKFEKKKLL